MSGVDAGATKAAGHDVCNGVAQVAGNAWHPVRAQINKPWSDLGKLANIGTGAQCQWNSAEWVDVCYGGRSLLGASATTFGCTINTPYSQQQFYDANGGNGSFLAHEVKHSDQWALFGELFPLLDALGAAESAYLIHVLGFPGDENSWNPFEVWAGLGDGGYHR